MTIRTVGLAVVGCLAAFMLSSHWVLYRVPLAALNAQAMLRSGRVDFVNWHGVPKGELLEWSARYDPEGSVDLHLLQVEYLTPIQGSRRIGVSRWPRLDVPLLACLVGIVLTPRVLRLLRRRRGQCESCGYPRQGEVPVCPECGTPT